jgi:site-specific DNA-methyltransferase (adenine-specific)
VSQPIFSQNDVEIFNEDCLDYLKRQPNDSLKFTLTSPPYDNIRDYNGYSFPFEEIAQELWRTTKVGGVVAWNVADATVKGSETGTSMRQALYFMSLGFRLHDTMIYAKKNPMPAGVSSKRYHQAWEYIFILSKDAPDTFNPIMVKAKFGHLDANMKHRGTDGKTEYKKTKRNEFTKVRNIFEYSIGGGISTKDKVAFEHPAIMPEQLAHDMISTWTDEGDTVFDPFTGAGTTAKLCFLLGRKFQGTEISSEYCDIIQRRLDATMNPSPQPINQQKKKIKTIEFANPDLFVEST